MVVADASVLVAALVDRGPAGQWAETWLTGDAVLGPALAPAEVTNVLRRLERTGEISDFEAASANRDLFRLALRLFPFAPFADRVWSLRNNLTSYDAWYVALAESSGCPVVTLDARLGRAPGLKCQIIVPPAPLTAAEP